MRVSLPPTLVVIAMAYCVSACGGDGGGGGGGGGTRVNGIVTAGLDRDPDFGDEFSAVAAFFQETISFPAFPSAGTCEDNTGDAVISLEDATFLDAGVGLELSGPNGDVTLDPAIPGLYFASGSAGLFAPGGTYTLTAPGGVDVDAFSDTFAVSGGFTLTSPDPSSSPTLTPGQDFAVTWTSTAPNDLVYVNVEQYNFDTDETVLDVICYFADDGSGTIPGSDLANLSNDPDLDTDIYISKTRAGSISVPGVGNVLVGGDVSYYLFGDVP